jgi:L-ascorbate metabolism protein UlaG (beta-lactamase superfamily)
MTINRFFPGFLLGLALLLPAALAAQDKAPVTDTIPSQNGDIKIHPINHATLALMWQGKTVYVDPVGGSNVFKGLPAPDLILITHIHGDHFSVPTLNAVAGATAKLVGPPTVVAQLPTNLASRATIMTNGESQEFLLMYPVAVSNGLGHVGVDIGVEAVPAYNLTPARLSNHPKGRDNGYVLTMGGKRIYLSGDTEDIPEMLALKNIDVAFICMNLPYTMDVEQAARAVKAFKPKIVYPYHYRGSDLEKFKSLVGADSGVEVRIRDWYATP